MAVRFTVATSSSTPYKVKLFLYLAWDQKALPFFFQYKLQATTKGRRKPKAVIPHLQQRPVFPVRPTGLVCVDRWMQGGKERLFGVLIMYHSCCKLLHLEHYMLPQDNFSLSFFLGLDETQGFYNYLSIKFISMWFISLLAKLRIPYSWLQNDD